jgi:small subunit ribosomal protein S1
MMTFMKMKQREKKRAARVWRPLSFQDRTPLSALQPGMELQGTVISLTDFGAYIDVGTVADGLLHVSQISAEQFIEHPRTALTPGEQITVRVRSLNPDKKKLHLTMLPVDVVEQELSQVTEKDRIPLTELKVDDELWGELKRVTDYGAYVEVGAEVPGFLHFMDHPAWQWQEQENPHPTTFMKTSDRVRVWVADVDLEKKRLKLTANRPTHLPGPRRELRA